MISLPLSDHTLERLDLIGIIALIHIGGEQLDKTVIGILVQILSDTVFLFAQFGHKFARVATRNKLERHDLDQILLHQGFDQGVHIAVLPCFVAGHLDDLGAGKRLVNAPQQIHDLLLAFGHHNIPLSSSRKHRNESKDNAICV